MAGQPSSVSPEAPLGIYPATVDLKGRLKLPADMQRYLAAVLENDGSENRVFVTTVDRQMIRIYPVSLWKQNEILLEQETDDPAAAEDITFLAKDLGGSSDIDSQGRVLVPAELRRLLNIEGQPVWLDCYKGRINLYGKDVYEERQRRYRENTVEKLRKLERKGLK